MFTPLPEQAIYPRSLKFTIIHLSKERSRIDVNRAKSLKIHAQGEALTYVFRFKEGVPTEHMRQHRKRNGHEFHLQIRAQMIERLEDNLPSPKAPHPDKPWSYTTKRVTPQ